MDRTALIAVSLLVTLGLAACQSDAADQEGAAPEPIETTPAEEPAEEPGATELVVTHTGEVDEGGCTYDGPSELTPGSYHATLLNESTEVTAHVTLSRLAEGYTYEDFLAYIRGLGDTDPVVPPLADHDDAAHDWMEGDWRGILQAPPDEEHVVDAMPVAPGSYAMFCYSQIEPGERLTHVWPLTGLTITE
jgi:hypothetical protein